MMKKIVVDRRPKSKTNAYIKRDLPTLSNLSSLSIAADSTRSWAASEKLKGKMKIIEVNAFTKVIAPSAETPR